MEIAGRRAEADGYRGVKGWDHEGRRSRANTVMRNINITSNVTDHSEIQDFPQASRGPRPPNSGF
jgi:hypothetical protein